MDEQEITAELMRMAEQYKAEEGRRRVRMVAQPQDAGNAQAIAETPQSGPDLNEYAYVGAPTPSVPSRDIPDPTPLPYSPPVGTAASTGGPTNVFQPQVGEYASKVRDLAKGYQGTIDEYLKGGQGSLRRAIDRTGFYEEFPKVVGPHLGAFTDKVGTAAGLMAPGSGAMHDATEAGRQLELGNYGKAAGATLLGAGSAALDFFPGAAAVKGVLKGLTGGTRYINDVLPAAGAAGAVLPKAGTWWHGVSENKLQRPLEEMSATHIPTGPMKPRQIVTPSEVEGEWMAPLIGDRTAAGSKLTAVNETPLAHAVEMQGGPGYMQANDALWASQKGAANTFQSTRVGKLAEETGKAPLAVYTAMSPTGGDYAHMTADTLLGALPSAKISQKNLAKFRAAMKDRGYPIPEFSTDNIDALRKEMLGPESGRMREAFVQEMARKPFQDAGFPDVGSARFATTDPAILHDPSLSSGYMIGRTAPGQPTVTNPAQHMTYSTQIPGQLVGGFEFPIPKDKMWLDYYRNRVAQGRNPATSNEDYAFRLKQPAQKATPEWVDTAEEYLRRRRAGVQ